MGTKSTLFGNATIMFINCCVGLKYRRCVSKHVMRSGTNSIGIRLNFNQFYWFKMGLKVKVKKVNYRLRTFSFSANMCVEGN